MGLLDGLKTVLRRGSAAPPPAVDLATVDTARLQTAHAAGRTMQAAVADLAAEGRTVLDAVMNGNAYAPWVMYPWQGGILDQRTSSQYFYHAHADYTGEHGHFHTFVYHQRKLVHLVAIGMDARGRINRLYTFNRWGPGDHYFPAGRLKGLLPRFIIRPGNDLDARVHAFVNGALGLFRAEIEHLFDERDATFANYRAAHNGASPFEDRALEITSAVPADVDVQMARVAAELQRRGLEPEAGPAVPPGVTPTVPPRVRDNGNDAEAAAAPPPGDPAEPRVEPIAERPTAHLQRSHEAGLALRALAAELQAEGRTVVDAVMNGKPHEVWAMYPWQGGVIDKATRSQYFYHSHPQSPEHGHFHVFYHHRGQLAHLGAIAMDDRGEPIRLFTTNRWVTDEFYLPAHKLTPYLAQFRIANEAFDRPVNETVRNLLLLFQAELGALLHARDAVYAAYRAGHNGRSPFEDRDLEVTSSLEVNVDAQIDALEDELRRRGAL